MQNGGFCYAMIPAIKALYKNKEDQVAALKRHLEFFNTHPYMASPIIGVTLALEEDRAHGSNVDDQTINGVKVGMMGPLAGVGDPVFWFTLRPMLGALGASLAMSGNVLGPIIFFLAWNIIRWAFMWYTQEFGYKAGMKITDDLSGGLLQKSDEGSLDLRYVRARLACRALGHDQLQASRIDCTASRWRLYRLGRFDPRQIWTSRRAHSTRTRLVVDSRKSDDASRQLELVDSWTRTIVVDTLLHVVAEEECFTDRDHHWPIYRRYFRVT